LAEETYNDALFNTPLSVAEIDAWAAGILAQAQNSLLLNNPAESYDPYEGYAFEYPFGTLYMSKPAHGPETVLLKVLITDYLGMCPRGLTRGNSLQTLLASYPNENPSLRGDYNFAALYVFDQLAQNQTAGWAWVHRNGQDVTLMQCAAYALSENGRTYRDAGVVYVLENGGASSITVYGLNSAQTISREEVEEDLANLRQIQASDAYVSYTSDLKGEEVPIFEREDFRFANIDVLGATPRDFIEKLGAPQNVEEAFDGQAKYIKYEWSGIDVHFVQLPEDKTPLFESLRMAGGVQEGPRGLRIGDTLDSVLARFCNTNDLAVLDGVLTRFADIDDWVVNSKAILYELGEAAEYPPYGILTYENITSAGVVEIAVRYATLLGDEESGTVGMLRLSFENNRLQELMLYMMELDIE